MTAEPDALFPPTAALSSKPGAVAQTFRRLVQAAQEAGTLMDEDSALIEGVAVLAESLDTAHRVGGLKGGYLAAQAFPPYQRGLHALRLPVELAAPQAAPAPTPATPADDAPDWLRDAFGSPE